MTYLLVLFLYGQDGTQKQYNMALFTDAADCTMAGALVSGYLTENNSYGVNVRYSCEPTT